MSIYSQIDLKFIDPLLDLQINKEVQRQVCNEVSLQVTTATNVFMYLLIKSKMSYGAELVV